MQKDTPDHYPDWIRRETVTKEGGTVTHTVCDDKATLLFLADQACLTLHRWLSRAERPDHPDRLVFDLDPPGPDFEAVREAARHLMELLDELRLPAVLMTTGSKGLHVTVPLDGKSDFDSVRAFAQETAEVLAGRYPDRLTTAVRKQAREGPALPRRAAQRLRADGRRPLVGAAEAGRPGRHADQRAAARRPRTHRAELVVAGRRGRAAAGAVAALGGRDAVAAAP